MNIIDYANYVEQGLSHSDMAKIHGYTEEEMEKLVKSLGVYVDDVEEEQYEENHFALHRRWTDKEDQFLIDNHEGMDNVELSLALGRSYSSITARKHTLRKHTLKISPKNRLKLKKDKKYIAYKNGNKIAEGTFGEIVEQTGYSQNRLYVQSTPSGRRKSGDEAIKLYELE